MTTNNFDPDELVDTLRNKFVSMPRDEELRGAFERLNSHNEKIHQADGPLHNREGKLLVLLGRSGAGKTTSLRRMLSNHPDFPDYPEQHQIRGTRNSLKQSTALPLLSIKAPSPCKLVELARGTLTALGYPLDRVIDGSLAWRRTRDRLQMKGTRILHIDEMQHVTQTANAIEMPKIADTIKALLIDPQWPVSVIISGTKELEQFLNFDLQIAGRIQDIIHFELISPIDNARQIAAIANKLCSQTPLTLAAPDQDFQFWSRLIHAANCQFGKSIELFIDTIDHVLRRSIMNGDARMTIDDFAAVYARTHACGPAANPFISPEWNFIDTTKMLQRAPVLPSDQPTPSGGPPATAQTQIEPQGQKRPPSVPYNQTDTSMTLSTRAPLRLDPDPAVDAWRVAHKLCVPPGQHQWHNYFTRILP